MPGIDVALVRKGSAVIGGSDDRHAFPVLSSIDRMPRSLCFVKRCLLTHIQRHTYDAPAP